MAIDRGALDLARNADPRGVANYHFEPIWEQRVMMRIRTAHQAPIEVRLDFVENHVVNGVE